MCCRCSGYRKCCNRYIAFISIIMLILSVVIIIASLVLSGWKPVVSPDSANFGLEIYFNKSSNTKFILVFGIIILITSINGLSLSYSKYNNCFGVPFVLITFFTGVPMILLGMETSDRNLYTPGELRERFCAKD